MHLVQNTVFAEKQIFDAIIDFMPLNTYYLLCVCTCVYACVSDLEGQHIVLWQLSFALTAEGFEWLFHMFGGLLCCVPFEEACLCLLTTFRGHKSLFILSYNVFYIFYFFPKDLSLHSNFMYWWGKTA